MQEIERKYLLKSTIVDLLQKIPSRCIDITQFYTKFSPSKTMRFRKAGDRYYRTIKIGTGAIREEIEHQVPKHKYRKHQKERIGYKIKKRRCFIEIDGDEYSIDIFEPPFTGLYMLEIEFENEKRFRKFRLSDSLQPYLIGDVTEDPRFKNSNLALFGLPLRPDAPRRAERIVVSKLRSLWEEALHYRVRLLEKGDDEDLHQLRVSVRAALSLIKSFGFLFEDSEISQLRTMLKEIISITNEKRDLDVMRQKLQEVAQELHSDTLRESYTALEREIETLLSREHRYIKAYLQSRRFDEIRQRYECFLQDGYRPLATLYGGYDIVAVSSYVICADFRKIEKLHRKTDYRREWEKLHKLRIALKKLRYLLEQFGEFYEDRAIEHRIKALKKLQKLLGVFHDASQQERIFEKVAAREHDIGIIFLIQNILLPRMQTFQQAEVSKIRAEVVRFLKQQRSMRSFCTAPKS